MPAIVNLRGSTHAGAVQASPTGRRRRDKEDMTDDDWAADYERVQPSIDGEQ